MQLLLLASEGSSQLLEAIEHNPTFIVMNLICSGFVLTIVIERILFQVTRYRVNSTEFFAQIKKLVLAGNIDRAIKNCEAKDYPILQLVKAGLTNANKDEAEIDAALSEKLSELKPQAEKRIGALWSLANIATLIGLLGTVSGLIATFNAIAAPGLSQAIKQQKLSNGIAEAMYNTALGLGIAVFCMITHIILHTRAKAIQHDLESTMERTFNLLTIQNRRGQH
ncbi:MAG: MotA/TolQ/ExbB proton channel family protein [Polyangiaceae bacterium]|nr:MotA/TolQ/ExbB proton channel family protein [Polyangiaceae bacterium]MCW5790871.1 MotA/TolQ/ExbB proton channel family protein [Polyangiaceae bacterium]